jgi:ketosteroid isomerase-like protein
MAAFSAGDAAAAIAMCSEDVEHRAVGPHGVGRSGSRETPLEPRGKAAVQEYLACRFENIETESIVPVGSYYGEDFCVIEHEWTGTVHGHFLSAAEGQGRRVTAPWLHVWEFRDGLISRIEEWPDSIAIIAQLMAQEPTELPERVWSGVERVSERANRSELEPVIDEQLAAFAANDAYGMVSMCTEDLELETIGFHRVGHLRGKDAARLFKECLFSQIETETMVPTRSYYGEDFCIVEHQWTGTVKGHFLCVPSGERLRVSVPWIRVCEFRDGLISRQRVWLDCIGIIHQLNDQLDPQGQPEVSAHQLRSWSNAQWIGKRVAMLSALRASRSRERADARVAAVA